MLKTNHSCKIDKKIRCKSSPTFWTIPATDPAFAISKRAIIRSISSLSSSFCWITRLVLRMISRRLADHSNSRELEPDSNFSRARQQINCHPHLTLLQHRLIIQFRPCSSKIKPTEVQLAGMLSRKRPFSNSVLHLRDVKSRIKQLSRTSHLLKFAKTNLRSTKRSYSVRTWTSRLEPPSAIMVLS